ncbi:vacuolar protein sorting-associated protein 60.2 [Senna tora]|uniref:Vacuolar protein sorting-associated protein 60.2 n=1 Tax=Senna tora TaxID=362788 RepID=A0A834TGC8_9FABA|nr:vacuolar protein sorting-associated protein 60.2 [Senna tora]
MNGSQIDLLTRSDGRKSSPFSGFGGMSRIATSIGSIAKTENKEVPEIKNFRILRILDKSANKVATLEEVITKRGDTVEDKIKKLDVELSRYKEQIKKTRPGPAQEAVKARAMRVLKQKRMYEGQRDMLYNQTFNLDQVAFAAEGIKDAQQTMSALKSANKELKGMMKTVKIQDIDNMQDEMMDLMDVSNEIQESLGRSYNVPDDIDEDELMGELDALEADMGNETEMDGVPSYLQPDKEPDLDAELNLPTAPTGHTAAPPGRSNAQAEDELGLPAVPRASLRG